MKSEIKGKPVFSYLDASTCPATVPCKAYTGTIAEYHVVKLISNIDSLKMSYRSAYGTLFNDTLDEYDENMRERFDGDSLDAVDIIDCR